jgi:hypothetical protein
VVILAFGALFVIVIAVTLLAAVLVPREVARRQAATRVGCEQHLTGVGYAVNAYVADKRRYPHVAGPDQLDGVASTADTPRVWRELLTLGYLEDVAPLRCPATPRYSTTEAERARQRAWLTAPTEGSPAPSLAECEELSYGWTRRALPAHPRADAPLAADKAVFGRREGEHGMRGNHTDGWNVLRADASVRWLSVYDEPFPGPRLWGTADPARDGYLPLKVQANADLLR